MRHLTGSKRKARRAEAERRKTERFKRELARVYELSRCIKDEQELELILGQLSDDPVLDATTGQTTSVRNETRKLITPFLLFQVGERRPDASAPSAEVVQDVADLAYAAVTQPAPPTILLTDAPEIRH